MSTLRAHVHYEDWEGTAAADVADKRNLRSLLEKNGAFDPETEFLAAIELSIWENQAATVEQAHIRALIAQKPPGENWGPQFKEERDSIPLRSVPIEMSIAEFLGLFKRFAVTLTTGGLGLTGRPYEVKD
jgi:hypothetical protein